MKNAALKRGFTLIELLVVIVILGVLGGLSVGGYTAFIESAKKKNAADVCAQIKVAWTNYHREVGFWPDELAKSDLRMTPEMCEIIGKSGFLDVLYIDDDGDNAAQRGLKKNKDKESELKVGMLSPIGLEEFKRRPNSSTLEQYLYHFAVDKDENGMVEGGEGLPQGASEVRGDVAVWCYDTDGTTIYADSW